MNGMPCVRTLVVVLLLVATGAAPGVAELAADGPRSQVESGQRLAEAVAMVTGVPISPLVGISALGALRWWNTPEAERAALAWYERPAAWGTGLFLAFLFAANTTIAGLVPGLKKPMDFVEHYENQASALLASPIVLIWAHRLIAPELDAAIASLDTLGSPALGSAGVAALAGGAGLPAFLAPIASFGAGLLALVAYTLVFLAFHAIQVLIALSPSALLDALLRLFRVGVLAVAGAATVIHPYVGAAFGLFVLLVSLFVAGWSFRLFVFGSVFARDLLFTGGAVDMRTPAAFSGSALAGVPARSWGRIELVDGAWRFSWRPWLVLQRRSVPLAGDPRLRKGILSPVLFAPRGLFEPTLVRFPPRQKGHEAELASALGGVEVVDGRIVRGLRATWAWLRQVAWG